MAVSDQALRDWFVANPGASDKYIRSAMDEYGVSVEQMARAAGNSVENVQARYDAAGAPKQPAFNPAATKFDNPFAFSQQNPYLDQMSQSITSQVTDNLNRNIMPQIASGAQLAGGFGGSRQGVVEANALKDANQGLSNSLTAMRFGDYNNQMGRQLQKYGMDQSYNLGLGQLQLGNRNTDLNQVQLGANLFQNGNTGFMNTGSGVYNLGLTQQQAPWQVSGNLNNTMTPYTGLGSTTGNYAGNPAAGALGGAVAGSQLYNLWNQGNTSTPSNIYNSGNTGGYNVSNGFAFDNSGMML